MGRKPKIAGALRELMVARGHHAWTLEELRQALAVRGLQANFSSVFRATAKLETDGVVRRVELDDGRTHLEMRDEHHDHLRCRICGEVTPVPCGSLSAALAGLESTTGFLITDHRLVLSGTCPSCQERAALPATPASPAAVPS